MQSIVIQDSNSFRFLSDEGNWNYELKSARKFNRIAQAAEHCATARFKQVHIVVGSVQPDGRFNSASKTIVRLQHLNRRQETNPGAETRRSH